MYDAEIISLEMPWVEWGDDVGLWILLEKDGLRDCIFGRRELDESVILSVYANFVSGKINQKFEKKKEVFEGYMDVWEIKYIRCIEFIISMIF